MTNKLTGVLRDSGEVDNRMIRDDSCLGQPAEEVPDGVYVLVDRHLEPAEPSKEELAIAEARAELLEEQAINRAIEKATTAGDADLVAKLEARKAK